MYLLVQAIGLSLLLTGVSIAMPLVKGTLYLQKQQLCVAGTFSYQNSAQKELGIHYNDLRLS